MKSNCPPGDILLKSQGQSLSYHVGTPISSNPDLMVPPRLDVYPLTNPVRFLLGVHVLWERDGQVSVEDQMCGETGVRVGTVIRVPTLVLSVSLPP